MSRNLLIGLCIFLSLTFFIIDMFTPLGVGEIYGIFFSIILLLTLLIRNPKITIIFMVISILFITAGYFLSPGPPTYIPFLNRFVTIIVIIILSFIIIKMIKFRQKEIKYIKELEVSNKELESFNYISSHDLQEPLRKIKTFANLLLSEKNLSEEGKYYSERLFVSAEKSQMLINDLLAYSRMGTTARNLELTDLNKLFDEVIEDFKESIREKKTEIINEGLCETSVIRFQFHQLLANLISNSLKFTSPDRQPAITIKSEIIFGDKPKLLPQHKYCHIIYSDNGIGFDPKFNEKIFELFERLNHDKYPGTGIGLAICKKIVENHNGIITASGELDKGARFDIYIPIV